VLILSGCATTSFAPPVVNLEQELKVTRTQTFFNATCSPKPDLAAGVYRTTNGALLLISNYILTYRCQADRAAEGRQFFEVPGFLIAAGAATAAAFGAPADVAIGAGAAGSALSHAKSYYAPKDKAVVLNDGLDAFLCIQNEAVGIDPYTLKTLSEAQKASGAGSAVPGAPIVAAAVGEGVTDPQPGTGDDAGPEVYISSERQYFEMVRSALFATERVVAQRLSASGTPFDTAGVIAEITALNKKVEDEAKESEAKDPVATGEAAKTAAVTPGPGIRAATFTLSANKLKSLPDAQVGRTVIKLRTLQPKLDRCIVRAKV
jgi:hypothetical protein